MSARIIFVTGTDTGVGKTLLTALLLHYLRSQNVRALAIKPFCSGGREDVELLQSLQNNELSLKEMNPFYFSEALAPFVAKNGQIISQKKVLEKISAVKNRCDVLLIEGSGGIMVPLAENYLIADLIKELSCEVVIVARNKLGTINHTLLSVAALQAIGIKDIRAVLMGSKKLDLSAKSNAKTIKIFSGNLPVFTLRFLGEKSKKKENIKKSVKKIKKTLAQILESGSFIHVLSNGERKD